MNALIKYLTTDTSQLLTLNISENGHLHLWHNDLKTGFLSMLRTANRISIIVLSVPNEFLNSVKEDAIYY
jgi:hypothetical protein